MVGICLFWEHDSGITDEECVHYSSLYYSFVKMNISEDIFPFRFLRFWDLTSEKEEPEALGLGIVNDIMLSCVFSPVGGAVAVR